MFIQLEETEAYHGKLNEDHLLHAPDFTIKPRSHTVWEKENVKLHCSVIGWPEPHLTWYGIFMETNGISYTKLSEIICWYLYMRVKESINKFVLAFERVRKGFWDEFLCMGRKDSHIQMTHYILL